MSQVYTSGVWVTKPGKEDEFVKTWSDLASWTKGSFEGAISVVLLRDRAEGRRFISVGPWRDVRDIDAWRASEGFRERVRRLEPLLERFEPATLELVVEVS